MNPPHEFKVMRVRECTATSEIVDNPERAAEYWRANIPKADWYDACKESFVVLILNTRRRILGHNLVAIGSLDSVTVMPREVFAPILAMAGHAAILMHNHPSGDATPSQADIKTTRDLIRAGQLLKIEILDHVIIGQQNHVSLKTLGFFY